MFVCCFCLFICFIFDKVETRFWEYSKFFSLHQRLKSRNKIVTACELLCGLVPWKFCPCPWASMHSNWKSLTVTAIYHSYFLWRPCFKTKDRSKSWRISSKFVTLLFYTTSSIFLAYVDCHPPRHTMKCWRLVCISLSCLLLCLSWVKISALNPWIYVIFLLDSLMVAEFLKLG